MAAVDPPPAPQIIIIRCPNKHEVPVSVQPGFIVDGVIQPSREDPSLDCPVCGLFRRGPDGTFEPHITPEAPRETRPIVWCVPDLTATLHRDVPSKDERTAMAESGRLRWFLQRYRREYEARGVDFDAVVAVIAAKELVPSHSLPEQ